MRRPSGQVVGEDRACEPCRVGVELAGRAVFESGSFFEVADREFDGRVITVELIRDDSWGVEAGDERVVAPIGPELQLGGIRETSASHDESEATFVFVTAGHVEGLRDVGFAAVGVGDRLPRMVIDLGDTRPDLLVDSNSDRPPDAEASECVDQRLGPEPAVGSEDQRPGRSPAPDPSDKFFDEAFRSPLRRSFPEPGV